MKNGYDSGIFHLLYTMNHASGYIQVIFMFMEMFIVHPSTDEYLNIPYFKSLWPFVTWILVETGTNFSIAVGLIRLRMSGVKSSRV